VSAAAINADVPSGPRTLRALLALVLFGATGFIIAHDWLGLGGPGLDELPGGYLYDAVVVTAGVALVLRGLHEQRERLAWMVLAAAVLCWAAGELYWTGFILHAAEPPYPSPADAFYLAFYPLAAVGLALLVRARAHELDWRRWTDGAIAALGTAALGSPSSSTSSPTERPKRVSNSRPHSPIHSATSRFSRQSSASLR